MWKNNQYTINFALIESNDNNNNSLELKANTIIRKEKVKVKPSVGEIVYFDDKLPYYRVENVYHSISSKQHVWVYLSIINIK